jgi:glycosyltransferase involved in cell wall biosynthesis
MSRNAPPTRTADKMNQAVQPRRILVLCPDPPGYSGHRRATELMIQVIEQGAPDYDLLTVRLPGLPRTQSGWAGRMGFLANTTAALFRLFWLAATRRPQGLFIALSQTRFSLFRDLWLIRLIRLASCRLRMPVVFALNGSLFMNWNRQQGIGRQFRKVLGHGRLVSCVGPAQQRKLQQEFESRQVRAVVIPNTCEFDLEPLDQIRQKHTAADGEVRVLHLSTLMEPKGYVELAEAAARLAGNTRMTLCGKIATTRYDRRFESVDEAATWLREQCRKNPRLTWIEGAVGEAKHRLYREAHIFVLPSRYPVEAQPLVLLEAMACGCAIVTTRVGEIPFMVDEQCAVLPDSCTPDDLARVIRELVDDPQRRLRLAEAASGVFTAKFDMNQYFKNWKQAFDQAFRPADQQA